MRSFLFFLSISHSVLASETEEELPEVLCYAFGPDAVARGSCSQMPVLIVGGVAVLVLAITAIGLFTYCINAKKKRKCVNNGTGEEPTSVTETEYATYTPLNTQEIMRISRLTNTLNTTQNSE